MPHDRTHPRCRHSERIRRGWLLAALALLAGCQDRPSETLAPLPPESLSANAAAPRTSGVVGDTARRPPSLVSVAPGLPASPAAVGRAASVEPGGADVTLNFADADIREVARTILGSILGVTYTIDPSVHGTTTVSTPKPVSRTQALAILQNVLAQNGATIIQSGSLYQVLPISAGATSPLWSGIGGDNAGASLVQLRYAVAKDLVKVLEPFVSQGGKIAALPAQNAVLVTGDPIARASLVSLVQSFDVDVLAHQSYAVFPVTAGTPDKAADELRQALQADGGNLVKVVAMARVNAVLVVASEPRYIDDARRVFGVIDATQNATERNWHVYYVQNGESGDLELLLQRAFTPDHVTSTGASDTKRLPPATPASLATQPGSSSGGSLPGLGSNTATSGTTGATTTGGGIGQSGESTLLAQLNGGGDADGGGGDAASPATQPLSAPGADDQNRIRIIANRKNNALLIYATPSEYAVIQGMLQKVDIIPLQVQIDATIAEVTLNNNLQYGTQFFFQNGGLSGALSQSASTAFSPNFPGFVLAKSTQFALNALQDVTTVKVLSSPQLTVLDNEQASMEVGDEVPYISQTSQSTDESSAPVINSVNYQQTGVILQVVPRVNTGGLVSLDIDQEVSTPESTTSSTIQSPTFSNRSVRSRVVVQDGQTIGLAGLISDNDSRENAGLPIIKDIPLLGSFFGNQNNMRQRVELLVLITPHVVYDQSIARDLTEDLREKLSNAAFVPQDLQDTPVGSSSEPNAVLNR
jgi:general secretion pathway protein D